MKHLAQFLVFLITSSVLAAAHHNVIIVAGQSNAVSAGTDADDLTPDATTDAQIRLFSDVGNGATWTTLEPVNGRFGPEITLARALHHADIDDLVVIKVASGGSNLYEDWEKGNTNGRKLYDLLFQRIDEAMGELIQGNDDTVTILALFWMQGETDAKSAKTDSGSGLPPPPQPETAESYGENLKAFFANLRTDLALPRLKIILGRLGDLGLGPRHSTGAGYYEYLETVKDSQMEVAEGDAWIQWVDTDDLPLSRDDHLHFTSASIETLGNRFAEAYFRTPGFRFPAWITHRPDFADPDLVEGADSTADDPDGDGFDNLVEFALGLDPSLPDADPLQSLVLARPSDGGRFIAIFPRNPLALGVEVRFEFSDDLANWQDAISSGWQLDVSEDTWRLTSPDLQTAAFVRVPIELSPAD